ncbi:MAG: protein kinase [Candidatus Melainabacteria bacterium]|nr:protein kinase [Candidatus Melainabacteria bacterium]
MGTKAMDDFDAGNAENPTLSLSGSSVKPETSVSLAAEAGLFTPGNLFLGKYNIKDRIGAGGMGVVYRCSQVFIGKDMAIKTLNQSSMNDEAAQRFQTEAKAAGSLNHPNLVSVYDFGVTESGTPYMVMDFVPGKTLQDVLSAHGQMPLETVIDIFIQCAYGMAHAHEKGVLHRDIKPSNIVLMQEENIGPGSIRILDFGIAKITSEGAQTQELTRTGMVIGSPLYMSPEQTIGRKMDARTDIYSLGCVLFECLCGAPPFQGETVIETLILHQTETPRPLREASMGREFPCRLQELVSSMMAKSVDERIDSMSAVHDELVKIRGLIENPDNSRQASHQKENQVTNTSKEKVQKPAVENHADINSKLLSTPAIVSAIVAAVLGISVLMVSQLTPPPQKPVKQIPLIYGRFATPGEERDCYDHKVRKALAEAISRGQDLVHVAACEFSQSQFEILGNEKWIRKLELIECSLFTPSGLATILKNQVESLNLRGSDLNDDCLGAISHCHSLHHLSLEKCTNISPTGLMEIARMKNLQTLNVSRVPVSDEVLRVWADNMHDCINLDVSQNQLIGDNSLRIIGRHRKEFSLNVANTSVSDEGLKYLGKNLRVLNLIGDHRVTDRGIKTLVNNCPNLIVLQMPGTSATVKGILKLTKLKKLHDLELGKLNIDAATRNHIRDTFKAREVNTYNF